MYRSFKWRRDQKWSVVRNPIKPLSGLYLFFLQSKKDRKFCTGFNDAILKKSDESVYSSLVSF